MEGEVQDLAILSSHGVSTNRILARPTISKAGENADLNMLMSETIPSEFEQFK
jgi:hypothetical protein